MAEELPLEWPSVPDLTPTPLVKRPRDTSNQKLSPNGLDYNTYTDVEPRHFLEARLRKVVDDRCPREDIIQNLRRLDRKPSFSRFLELPTELRCAVYGYLLDLGPPDIAERRTCFPQILRASKEIYREAEDVLYGSNVFTIVIRNTVLVGEDDLGQCRFSEIFSRQCRSSLCNCIASRFAGHPLCRRCDVSSSASFSTITAIAVASLLTKASLW